MKIGDRVLCKRKEQESYQKRYILDYLQSTKMVSFGDSEYSEPVYYHDISDWDIKPFPRGIK